MSTDLLATLRDDRDRLVAIADGPLDVAVPTCPGWAMSDLLVHLGRVHRWARAALDTDPSGEWPPFGARPADGEPLGPWLADGIDQLDTAFSSTALDRPAWGFAGPSTVGWWLRRQALETAMHRWDAEIAAGRPPTAMDVATAATGIDEWCELEAARWFRPSDDLTISVHLHATDDAGDLPGEWFLEADSAGLHWSHGHHKGDIAVRASRSDLFLLVWRRVPPADLEVLGDPDRLDEFLLASAVD